MKHHILILSIFLALTGIAQAEPGTAFRSPSGNIHCMGDYRDIDSGKVSAGVSCEIRGHHENIRPAQKRPDDCDLDWGDGFSIGAKGRAEVYCHGDTVALANSRVLKYGDTVRGQGWQCTSRPSGMMCKNRSGHGFDISRGQQRLF